MRIRTTATVAALVAASGLLAAPAVASAPTSTAGSASLAASRTLNVPGVPVRASFPASWPSYSPKSLYNSHTRRYPAGVRYVARLEHESAATYVAKNRVVNLEGYGPVSHTSVPTYSVIDLGVRNVTRAQVSAILRGEGGRVSGSSAVRTRFGTVYRVHYHMVRKGHVFNGVAGVAHVKGRSLLVDSSAYSLSQSKGVSNTILRSMHRR